MAIVKNNFRVSKFEREFSPVSRDSMSTDEDELYKRCSVSESDNDDDEDEDGVDSGAGSDDFDMSELGEVGAESCQLGGSNCSIPYELYDLPDLGEILTLDAWNNCLTEEERFSLAEYLPDMDQETFMRTLKELFSGNNFHFGSPVAMLFDMLKKGLCEPRVTLYRQGLNFFQKREHYHLLRKYQNSMVGNLIQIRDAWENYAGYSIEERLRVLNIQRSLMYEKMEARGLDTDNSDRDESGDGFWGKKLKDMKPKPKIGRRDVYSVSPTLNNSSRGRHVPLEPAKYGKSNPKGILKFAGSKALSEKGFVGRFSSSIKPGLKSKSRSCLPTSASPRQDQVSGYDSESAPRSRGQIRGEDDAEGPPYEMDYLRDRTHGTAMSKVGLFKSGKKSKSFKTEDEYAAESLMGLPLAIQNDLRSQGRNRSLNQLAELEMLKAKPIGEKSSYKNYSRVPGTKAKHSQKVQKSAAKDQMKARKDQTLQRGKQADWSLGRESIQRNKVKEEAFDVDYLVKHDEWSVKGKRWKMGKEFQTGKNSVGFSRKVKSHRTFPTQMDDMVFHSDYRTKATIGKVKKKSSLSGGLNMEELRGSNMFARSEETESDSSEQVSEEEDNPLRNKRRHTMDAEGHQSTSIKAITHPKKGIKLGRKDMEYAEALEQLRMADIDVYPSKGKQKGKIRDPHYRHPNAIGISEESGYAGFAKTDNDGKKPYKLGKNGNVQGEPAERSHLPSLKTYPTERKNKGKVDHDYSVPQANYMDDYVSEEKNSLHLKPRLAADHGPTNKLGKKGQSSKAHSSDRHERSKFSLLGCNSKKRKVKADVKYLDGSNESDQMQASPQQQVNDSTSLRKRGKRKMEAETDSLAVQNSEPLVSERGAMDVEADAKPPKKPFTLITPTVHTGFSFSIIHLLSAVRMAMITPNAEDSSELHSHHSRSDGRHIINNEEQSRKHETTNVDMNNSAAQKILPSLTVQEIVNRVKSNPGDPCILETQEPLQDLVRGVLKVFSSRTAPLGAKGWKPLVCYEKCIKSWFWIGPHTDSSSDLEAAEEETSSEAWGLPHKMLVKLVDSFANWLKSGQETLQQIGSLPAPPITLMQPNLDEKERFRDLRAQKSLTTISPSSEEVRAYFRKEELLRYSVPDRAFSYTAADGKKSIVAPLRRCGGKPTSKARDHFMLKPDRPPHVTILCLVRDAAARLPGSIGTRADVCTLIRDSQYIVENVSDAQVNQVVSGALDRLHYERDPCVQFDGDRKLWVYLHRDREEEDFEDDGTSSTKKWKRQRKDGTEQADPGPLNIPYHGSGEPIAGGPVYDLGSDLNVEPSPIHEGRITELGYDDDSKQKIDDNIESYVGSGQGGVHLGWEAEENKMLCQENSTNEDFDDETFNRERPVGLLSAGLL